MDWASIILALFEAIRQCIEDRKDREAVERGLNKPGLRMAGQIRRVLRMEGLHGHELRMAVQDAMDELQSMTPLEIEELVTDAMDAAPSTIHVSTQKGN